MNTTVLVLVGLAVLWTIVLVPEVSAWFRRSSIGRQGSRGPVVSSARIRPQAVHSTRPAPRSLSTTALPYQGEISGRLSRHEAARRRGAVFATLCVLTLLTLVLAIVSGGIFVALNVLFDLALVAFVYQMMQRMNSQSAQFSRPQPSYNARPAAAAASPVAYDDGYDSYDEYESYESYDDRVVPLRRTVGY